MTATAEKIQDVATQRYSGQAVTAWLTVGLTYSTSTVLADITALGATDKLSGTGTLGSPTAGLVEITITFSNAGATDFVADGIALVIDGRGVIEDFSQESLTVPAGGSRQRKFSLQAV